MKRWIVSMVDFSCGVGVSCQFLSIPFLLCSYHNIPSVFYFHSWWEDLDVVESISCLQFFLSSLCWQKNEEGERGLDAILNKEYCFAPKMDTHRSLEEYLCKSVLLQNCSFYSAATVLALAACGMTSLTPLKWQPVPQSSVRFSHHIRWLPPISTNSRPSVEQTERKRCKTAIY